MIVAIDGALVPTDRAVVPVTDRGFLYGDSVFETFRTYDRRAHALDRHLARLARSAAAIELTLPVDSETLRREVRRVVAAGEGERRVRLIVTRGDAPALADDGARRVILGAPFSGHPAALYEEGVVVCTVEGERERASAKIGSYLTSILAARQARARGAYEALLVADGEVREGATSNFFACIGGTLRTPAAGMLPGVTRGVVLELARALGVPVEEGPLGVDELGAATEAFLTSATREVMPIRRIDERELGPPGPTTRRLAQAYRDTVPSRLDPA